MRIYQGYECKEPEAGKFTLCFAQLSNAIRWACHLQQELLILDWPRKLLEMGECQEMCGPTGEQCIQAAPLLIANKSS